ncbi:MAG TPA: FkbM family methyltransferase [Chthoniobacterales bacterium]|nr:FkbM family methyltransferase [Chthoniobacterales bacterium]
MRQNNLIPDLVVNLYRLWHGKLGLKGSGLLLRACAKRLPGFEDYNLRVPNLGLIRVNYRDSSGISWLNYSLGEGGLEEGMISAVGRFAPKRAIIWDVGANAGFFAAALIKRLDDYQEIRLFEPNPAFNSILRELSSLLPNVHSHNIALSDKPGSALLHVPKSDSSVASFTPCADSVSINVECTTGDLFLEQSGTGDPDIVIIDTEGNDCRVIKGIIKLIERKRPVVFFEHIFEAAEGVNAALPTDYCHFTVDDRSGDLVPGLDKKCGHNSVFVPRA